MTKLLWDKHNRRWVDKDTLWRPPAPRIHVISDSCEVRSMADGHTYTSKANYRQSLKDQGLVELGNEKITPKPYEPTGIAEDIQRAIQETGYSE